MESTQVDFFNGTIHSIYRQLTFLGYNFLGSLVDIWASQVAVVVKNLPANAGDAGGTSSIPGSGRSPRGEHGSLLQYSCLKNPMDREAWWAMVHKVTMSHT